MKSKIVTVMKKEFSRFFGDRRMVFSTLILPALMIYILYSFMGDGLMNQFEVDEDYISKVYICNAPASLQPVFDQMSIDIQKEESLDVMKEKVQNKEIELLAVFPKDFDAAVQAYDSKTSTEEAPEVELYYNSAKTESSAIYTSFEEMLTQYEGSMCNKFDINKGEQKKFDLATDKDSTGMFFSMMLPMLLLIFIFSGCMSIAPESIAGEKERGTIAKLLVSPTRRRDIALGKIISLSVLGLLCGTSSFIGTILSMPKLMQGEEMSASVYQVSDYVMLLIVIFSTVLVIVGLMSIISTFAKTVKEAGTYLSPIMVIVMLVGITSMFGDGAPTEHYMYLIPVYNSVQCMNGIFGFNYNIINIVITIVTNVLLTGILTLILSKMFNSEKVMFS